MDVIQRIVRLNRTGAALALPLSIHCSSHSTHCPSHPPHALPFSLPFTLSSSLSLGPSIIADDGWRSAEPEAERRASFSRVNDATVAATEDDGRERREGERGSSSQSPSGSNPKSV